MGGGEAGIRTLDTAFGPYNGLANRRLQPLGHLTAVCKYTADKHLRERRFSRVEATVSLITEKTAAFVQVPCEQRIAPHDTCESPPTIGHTFGHTAKMLREFGHSSLDCDLPEVCRLLNAAMAFTKPERPATRSR